MADLSRLKSQLMISGLQTKDNPLWQVINQLIEQIESLTILITTLAPSITNVTNTTIGSSGLIGADGQDGNDGDIGPQGVQGIVGPTGTGGAIGPTTIGPMGQDGFDGEDGASIPGIPGATGAIGSGGAIGPTTIGPMGIDGIDGEDGMPIPGIQGRDGNDGTNGLIGPPGMDGDGGGSGGDDWIPYYNFSVPNVLLVETILTDAQIKTLNSVPVSVLSAPGAGFLYVPLFWYYTTDFTAGAYSGASNPSITQGSLGTQFFGGSLSGLAVKRVWTEIYFGVGTASSAWDNQPMEITSDTDLTGGNAANKLISRIWYMRVSVL